MNYTHRWFIGLALPVLLGCIAGTVPSEASSLKEPVPIRLEGEREDVNRLLESLNAKGGKQGLSFVNVQTGYRFRILVHAESIKAADLLHGGGADAYAAVLGPNCDFLFMAAADRRVKRAGAVNGVSEQILKRLVTYLQTPPAGSTTNSTTPCAAVTDQFTPSCGERSIP